MSAPSPYELSEHPDLDAIRGDDEAVAQEAFARLWNTIRVPTLRMLARRNVVGEDAQDALQETAARLWRSRRTIAARSGGGWYALVRSRLGRVLAEAWAEKGQANVSSIEETEDIPQAEEAYLDAFVMDADRHRRILQAADALWLGEVEGAEGGTIQAAALALVYKEGFAPSEVATMFGVDDATLGDWLRDSRLLLRTAFSALCWPNDDLAAYVLKPDGQLTLRDLDRAGAGRGVPGIEGWSTTEARVVCWRIRSAFSEEEIVRAASGTIDRERVSDVLRRSRALYPFHSLAEGLRASLSAHGRDWALTSAGLWRRIAFEYHARHGLPRDHIIERATPAAEACGFRLGRTVLDNWLSRGRLYAELAAALEPES